MKLEFLLMLFDCCPFSGHSQEESKSSPCTPTHKCGRPQLHHTLLPSPLQAEQPQLFIGHLLQPHHPPLTPPLDFIGISCTNGAQNVHSAPGLAEKWILGKELLPCWLPEHSQQAD